MKTMFLMMFVSLLLSGCTADKPACTPEAVPPVPAAATFRVFEKTFSTWVGEMRVEDQKVTCWILSNSSGSSISCLSDAQRKDVTP